MQLLLLNILKEQFTFSWYYKTISNLCWNIRSDLNARRCLIFLWSQNKHFSLFGSIMLQFKVHNFAELVFCLGWFLLSKHNTENCAVPVVLVSKWFGIMIKAFLLNLPSTKLRNTFLELHTSTNLLNLFINVLFLQLSLNSNSVLM